MAPRTSGRKTKSPKSESALPAPAPEPVPSSVGGKKKYAAVLVIIIIAALAFGAYKYNLISFTGKSVDPDYSKYGNITEALRELREGVGSLPENRPDYLPPEVYQNLPAFPKDFYEIDILLTNAKLTYLAPLGEEYWKQPEFYPGWEEEGVKLHQNPEKGRYGVWGWGAYPADQGYSSLPGDDFTATTYFHSSWVIQSYQGMQMQAVFPEEGYVNGVQVSQDPVNTSKYFDISFDPEIFIVEPSFPIFGAEWAKRVQITVKISPGTPPGNYIIGVNPVAPPKQQDDEWRLQYRLKYASAGATGLTRPFFQILLEVREE
jgi:hypothetical protein